MNGTTERAASRSEAAVTALMTSSTPFTASAALAALRTGIFSSARAGTLSFCANKMSKAETAAPAAMRSAASVWPTSPKPIRAMRENPVIFGSILGRSVDIFETLLGQARTHVVNVKAEFAARIAGAAFGFLLLTLAAQVQHIGGFAAAHDDHAVVIGDDQVAGVDPLTGADDRRVDVAHCLLD